jgi:hypothetical protein
MRGEKLLESAADDVVIVSNYDAQRHCLCGKIPILRWPSLGPLRAAL